MFKYQTTKFVVLPLSDINYTKMNNVHIFLFLLSFQNLSIFSILNGKVSKVGFFSPFPIVIFSRLGKDLKSLNKRQRIYNSPR